MNAKLLVIAVLVFFLIGCSQRPECSTSAGDMTAPSAGCLVVSDGDLLLVKSMVVFTAPPVARLIDASPHNVRQSERLGKKRVL